MPQRNSKIRRGIYLGKAILELVRMGERKAARRAMREASKEPRTTYIAVIHTVRRGRRKGKNKRLEK